MIQYKPLKLVCSYLECILWCQVKAACFILKVRILSTNEWTNSAGPHLCSFSFDLLLHVGCHSSIQSCITLIHFHFKHFFIFFPPNFHCWYCIALQGQVTLQVFPLTLLRIFQVGSNVALSKNKQPTSSCKNMCKWQACSHFSVIFCDFRYALKSPYWFFYT